MGSCIMFAGKRYLTRVLGQSSGRALRKICRAQGTSAVGSGEHGGGSLTIGDRLKTGDIYLHRELGYRGIVLYPFTSKSTYYCETSGKVEEKKTEMYATMLLNDVNTRSHIEKYLTVMMVHHDGCFSNNIDIEGNNADASIVRAPLPGFDVVNHLDARPLLQPVGINNQVKAPYLELFFDEAIQPKHEAINAWKKSYDIHSESYTLRYAFTDDDLLAEFFIYPYDIFTTCNDRSKHINACYRYKLNISTNLRNDPDASLTVGPILWRIRGSAKGKEEDQSSYVFFTRSDYHTPKNLNHRLQSVQFNGDLFLPKRLDKFQATPLLVCRWQGIERNDEDADTRTFQYPPFQISMTEDYSTQVSPSPDAPNEPK